jgi:hypothetical protein
VSSARLCRRRVKQLRFRRVREKITVDEQTSFDCIEHFAAAPDGVGDVLLCVRQLERLAAIDAAIGEVNAYRLGTLAVPQFYSCADSFGPHLSTPFLCLHQVDPQGVVGDPAVHAVEPLAAAPPCVDGCGAVPGKLGILLELHPRN